MYACVFVWEHANVIIGTHRTEKTVSDSLELESQVVVSHLTCVLGTEFGFSGRAGHLCNHKTHCLVFSIQLLAHL